MCGRYASSRRPEDLVEEFEVEESHLPEPLAPDFNVAPTKEVYAVLERPAKAERAQQRQLRALRWGLVPSWAKDPGIGNRMINARMETVAEKPAYKRAFAARRCLLPADGYFEWYPSDAKDAGGKPASNLLHPSQGRGVLAMAGLYEFWRDPAVADGEPGSWLWTCTVITTDAEDDLGHIHDRMPLMVPRERSGQWLDPELRATDVLLGLLEPAAPGRLEAYPVSTLVSNVRNNGPELVEPLPRSPDGAVRRHPWWTCTCDHAPGERARAASCCSVTVPGQVSTPPI
ncbi:SOS response-associated peptidase [Nocardioides alcanivorans]|uniref:SOS response-associated peptidase n=1 Tax=Nocardioides alcanivorans TaxID=2897352 RepID=UPI001F160644|nr:SOS response-associated peptidase [Nocardioides alcanivorans]